MGAKIGVLGLQGDVREHLRALGSAGATPTVVKTAAALDGVDGLVLPGGESTTIGKLLDRFDLLEPLRARVAGGLPLFGTCAGLILMAREVEGPEDAPHRIGVLDVTVRRNAYGRQVDSFEARVPMEGEEEALEVAFIRAPTIERAGSRVEVLARHEGRPVLVREALLLAASFHPEITGEDRVHRTFVEMVMER